MVFDRLIIIIIIIIIILRIIIIIIIIIFRIIIIIIIIIILRIIIIPFARYEEDIYPDLHRLRRVNNTYRYVHMLNAFSL